MDKTDRNTIEELLPRYCEGVATEEERLQVEMWMSESDENRRMAKQIHALYLATDTVNVMKKVDTEKALLKVKSRMSGNRHKGTMWWQWAQRAAAILFIPLLVTLMLQYWGGNEQELAQIMEVRTNPGMMTSLTLHDGTLVYLNSESTLSYPSRFDNDTRNVTLQGEAYFEVAKNPEKKFIVSTSIEGYQGSTFKQLFINENMNSRYVLQVINLHRRILRENKVGSAIPHLNKKLFKAIEVPIPPYKEQQRIVETINKVFMSLDLIMESL